MINTLIHAEKYFNWWKIKINQEKTQAIIFPLIDQQNVFQK